MMEVAVIRSGVVRAGSTYAALHPLHSCVRATSESNSAFASDGKPADSRAFRVPLWPDALHRRSDGERQVLLDNFGDYPTLPFELCLEPRVLSRFPVNHYTLFVRAITCRPPMPRNEPVVL